MNMRFFLRQVWEKCINQKMLLNAVSINFSQAFDTMSRERLWQILRKFGCPEKFINLAESKDFAVSTAVKQSFVLGRIVFTLRSGYAGSGFYE